LHRLVAGPASRSYGVAVAKLAGLPEAVLARARALLAMLERGAFVPAARAVSPNHDETQLDLFAPTAARRQAESDAIETLRNLDLDNMTPLEALSLLARLKERV
jgi:DNA mismatch repair protein MutS